MIKDENIVATLGQSYTDTLVASTTSDRSSLVLTSHTLTGIGKFKTVMGWQKDFFSEKVINLSSILLTTEKCGFIWWLTFLLGCLFLVAAGLIGLTHGIESETMFCIVLNTFAFIGITLIALAIGLRIKFTLRVLILNINSAVYCISMYGIPEDEIQRFIQKVQATVAKLQAEESVS